MNMRWEINISAFIYRYFNLDLIHNLEDSTFCLNPPIAHVTKSIGTCDLIFINDVTHDGSSKMYGAREGSSSVHLVLSWPRNIKSWERDIMSWPRDRFVEVTTSLCRGLEMLCWGNDIHFSWPRLLMLRERHIFLVATSLMCKQTYVTIATLDYQWFINILLWIKKLLY